MLQQVCDLMALDERDTYFWGTHAGAELDLLVDVDRSKIGFEFKRTVSPKVTRSMRTALEDLALDELILVHGGRDSYPMDKRIHAVAASRLEADLPRSPRPS